MFTSWKVVLCPTFILLSVMVLFLFTVSLTIYDIYVFFFLYCEFFMFSICDGRIIEFNVN